MYKKLQILDAGLQDTYKSNIKVDFDKELEVLSRVDTQFQKFDFYTSVSVVFSSKIEGEEIELDSFLKHKAELASYQPDYTRKIDDLYDGYQFAQKSKLNFLNVLDCHKIITRNILQVSHQGTIRNGLLYVLTEDGKIKYVAANPEMVKTEIDKLFEDLDFLINEGLKVEDVFYFASMLHLVFVKIHPFEDGNGRMARLIENGLLQGSWETAPGLFSLKNTTTGTMISIIKI